MCRAVPKEEEDELELYLAEKEESNQSIDLLKYWKKKEIVWPALAKMVKQYLAAPASSAGRGRACVLWTLRGWQDRSCMMTSLKKSAKDSTLEYSLSAAFNTD